MAVSCFFIGTGCINPGGKNNPKILFRCFTVECPRHHTQVVVFTMFENKLGAPLAKLIGIAAVVPKSNGLANLFERIEALLEAQDALQRH